MKVAFHTLGCKVNSYESQAMLNMFEEAGYEEVDLKKWQMFMLLIPAQLQIWRSENQDRCCTAQKN